MGVLFAHKVGHLGYYFFISVDIQEEEVFPTLSFYRNIAVIKSESAKLEKSPAKFPDFLKDPSLRVSLFEESIPSSGKSTPSEEIFCSFSGSLSLSSSSSLPCFFSPFLSLSLTINLEVNDKLIMKEPVLEWVLQEWSSTFGVLEIIL